VRLEKGETIGERYSLVRAIGEGGMGAVWAALDTQTNELVALKVLREEERTPRTNHRDDLWVSGKVEVERGKPCVADEDDASTNACHL
jgi:serine/threonine protein kinase